MKIGVFVGRLCPIHIGHQTTIDEMLKDCGYDNSLIILGSVGQKATFRVLFSYMQRKNWIRNIYGQKLKVVGIPDFPNDNTSWLNMIDDLVYATFSHLSAEKAASLDDLDIIFYGGSVNDLDIFRDYGYDIKVVDRTKMPVSATVIRDMALRGMDISSFIHQDIKDDFLYKFSKIMEESEKWDTPIVSRP